MRIRQGEKWLARVFTTTNAEALVRSYDKWAASYDTDMLSLGYLNPAIAASLVGRYVRVQNEPVLDAGAGTGILGEILKAAGYGDLTGIDMSEGMLARASDRGAYRALKLAVLGRPLDFPDGHFAAVVSTGVFTTGHAPPSAFDELLRILRPGGHMIFTVSSWTYERGGFKKKQKELEATGRWRLLEATGPYRPMPFSSLGSMLTTRCFAYRAT